MKRKKIILLAAAPLLGFGLLGANIASAHGWFGGATNATPDETASRQQEMFTSQAQLLNINVDEVKNAWAEGKDLQTLAKEHGVSQEDMHKKMQELHKQRMKSELQTLVEKGVITQQQADTRLKTFETQAKKMPGKGKGHRFGMPAPGEFQPL